MKTLLLLTAVVVLSSCGGYAGVGIGGGSGGGFGGVGFSFPIGGPRQPYYQEAQPPATPASAPASAAQPQ